METFAHCVCIFLLVSQIFLLPLPNFDAGALTPLHLETLHVCNNSSTDHKSISYIKFVTSGQSIPFSLCVL